MSRVAPALLPTPAHAALPQVAERAMAQVVSKARQHHLTHLVVRGLCAGNAKLSQIACIRQMLHELQREPGHPNAVLISGMLSCLKYLQSTALFVEASICAPHGERQGASSH